MHHPCNASLQCSGTPKHTLEAVSCKGAGDLWTTPRASAETKQATGQGRASTQCKAAALATCVMMLATLMFSVLMSQSAAKQATEGEMPLTCGRGQGLCAEGRGLPSWQGFCASPCSRQAAPSHVPCIPLDRFINRFINISFID